MFRGWGGFEVVCLFVYIDISMPVNITAPIRSTVCPEYCASVTCEKVLCFVMFYSCYSKSPSSDWHWK